MPLDSVAHCTRSGVDVPHSFDRLKLCQNCMAVSPEMAGKGAAGQGIAELISPAQPESVPPSLASDTLPEESQS
jgi:hypothetical protein